MQDHSESPTMPAPPPDAELPASAAADAGELAAGGFRHYLVERRPDGSWWELGRGGMGVTYRAMDSNLHCPVALKVIGPQCFGGETSRLRFIREARLAAQIRHPNVAAVHHLETEGDDIFYAMELVDGITAEQWVRGRGPMSPELALDVAMQVCRALTAADQLQLVHRDIKPANIMLLADPADSSRVIVKVIDFGLARSTVPETTPMMTTCAFVGTPQFSSPEQIESLPLDTRSDIYSLGCALWYLLLGEAPFSGTNTRVMAMQLTADPAFERLAHLPASLRALLRRMLAKDPASRPQTPVALHTQIAECRAALPSRSPGGRSTGFDLPARLTAAASARLAAWQQSSRTAWESLRRLDLREASFRPSRRVVWSSLSTVVLIAVIGLAWRPPDAALETNSPPSQPSPELAALSPEPVPEPGAVPAASIPEPSPIPGLPPELEETAPPPVPPDWEPRPLELAHVQEESAPFWMSPEPPDFAPAMNLRDPQEVSLAIAPATASWQITKPEKKTAAKSSAKSRKPSAESRRANSGNPLEKVGRSVRGWFQRTF